MFDAIFDNMKGFLNWVQVMQIGRKVDQKNTFLRAHLLNQSTMVYLGPIHD